MERIQVVAIGVSVALLLGVLELVRRRKLTEEYSFLWIICAVALLILSVRRDILEWSARWVGAFQFDSGTFSFRIQADDGVRVYLDGLLVIDRWVDGYKEAGNRVIGVGSGLHTVTVEYYERTGNASIRLWWFKEAGVVVPQ